MFPFSFNLFSASLSSCAFHTLSVCCGDNATLQCANLTRFPSHVFWFKLNNEHNASSIASMRSADTHATLFDGFQSGKFNMSSDSVTLNLTIKHVNSSDSGLYFCGFKSQNNAVIQSATSLIVEGKIALSLKHTSKLKILKKKNSFNSVTSLVEEPQAGAPVMHLIGGALITVLVGAIALLAVKIRRLQKGA